MTVKPLKLKARDAEDLEVISAILQDAIVPLCDVVYRPEHQDFVLAVHRIKREAQQETGTAKQSERVCCALHIKGVMAAQLQGIRRQPGDMLELLAMIPEKGSLQLVFAGGAKIRLKLDDWALTIEDFGEPWPALCEPCHEAASK